MDGGKPAFVYYRSNRWIDPGLRTNHAVVIASICSFFLLLVERIVKISILLQQIFLIMTTNSKSLTLHVPNMITMLNLLMGCFSIVFAFQGDIKTASVLIFVGGVFDFCDGFAARLLHAYSELGKSLDSLADMVTFGLAPSVILYQLLNLAVLKNSSDWAVSNGGVVEFLIPCSAFIVAVFSALRLAKFNIDERQTTSFIGVPTPANAFLIASLPFVLTSFVAMNDILLRVYVLIPLVLVLSFLLVAEIPMLSLKFKNYSFAGNKSKYILILVSLVLLAIFQIAAYPLIFVLYIVLSVIDNPQKKLAV